MEQENIAPHTLAMQKVRTPVPSPRPGRGQCTAMYPVRNTFIHYGTHTPLRAEKNRLASPKTVPPNFAPEESLALETAPVPAWPPATRAFMSSAVPETAPRGAGVAPLRLFDFLPSPKVPEVMHPTICGQISQVPQMPGVPTMQVTQTMASPPTTFGAFDGANAQWQDMGPARMVQQIPQLPFGANIEAFQPIQPPWAPWGMAAGAADYSHPGSLPSSMMQVPAAPALMSSVSPLPAHAGTVLQSRPMEAHFVSYNMAPMPLQRP